MCTSVFHYCGPWLFVLWHCLQLTKIPRGNNVRSSIGIFFKTILHFRNFSHKIKRCFVYICTYIIIYECTVYLWLCYVQQHTEKHILILSSLIRNMHVHCTARSIQMLFCWMYVCDFPYYLYKNILEYISYTPAQER